LDISKEDYMTYNTFEEYRAWLMLMGDAARMINGAPVAPGRIAQHRDYGREFSQCQANAIGFASR